MEQKELTKKQLRKKRNKAYVAYESKRCKRNKLRKITFKKQYKQFKKSKTFLKENYSYLMKLLGKLKKHVFHKNKIYRIQSQIDKKRNTLTANSTI